MDKVSLAIGIDPDSSLFILEITADLYYFFKAYERLTIATEDKLAEILNRAYRFYDLLNCRLSL